MFPYLVADIGGTNARFALATSKCGQQFTIEHIHILNGTDYAQFDQALAAYLALLDGIRPTAACVAIAGPIDGDQIRMTNLPWSFSRRAVQQAFGFDRLEVINDFGAVAIATSRLGDGDLTPVKPGTLRPEANKAVLGAGTGLGVAGLARGHNTWLPIPSEGGHVNLAPATAAEAEVIQAGIKRLGHVSAEAFVSGPGLVNLYHCLCDVEGQVPQAERLPKDITAAALAASDPLCVATLNLFCAFFGTVSGNLVLTYGAKGGVYIAGGVVPRFVDFLRDSAFAERFANKGIMSHYVADVPVNIVGYEQIAFLGAAAWLDQCV